MKFKELSSMDTEALNKKLAEIELDLMKIRSQAATGTAQKNTMQIMLLKKTIARINTIKSTRTAKEN